MTARDYGSYRELYEVMVELLPPPNLLIYLKASVPTLLRRITRRGRDFERDISPHYLERLNALYEAWIEDFTLCPILTLDADTLDFVRFETHFANIARQILAHLQTEEIS